MKKLGNPFSFIGKIREKLAKSERDRIVNEINDSVQIREFDGKVFVSYKNIPLLDESDCIASACETVAKMRNNLKKYRLD